MPKPLIISCGDIIHNIKLSYQIPEVVEAIAKQKIIAEAAAEAGITASEEDLQQEGDRLRFAKKLVKAKDTLDWLKKHHLSLTDFEELVRNTVLSKKLAQHLFTEKVEKFYYEHQLDYITAVTYEVVLEDRDLALELFYAIEEGEMAFQEAARQYILNVENRRNGGYQGLQKRKDLRPEIAAAIFAANPPQILKPITTPKGVHLIWVEEIIQPELNEKVREEIQQELFSSWLSQQIESMEIITQLDLDGNDGQPEELRKQA
jgi:parvulin-like peptidyl-prolyl isomerase